MAGHLKQEQHDRDILDGERERQIAAARGYLVRLLH